MVRPAMLYDLETETKMFEVLFESDKDEYIWSTARCCGDNVREARLRWLRQVRRREGW